MHVYVLCISSHTTNRPDTKTKPEQQRYQSINQEQVMQAQFVKQYQQTSSFEKEKKRNHDSNETCHVMSIGPEKDKEIKSKKIDGVR